MVATVPASKGIVWLVCVTSCWAALTVIDMTHEFGDDAVYYPGNPPFNFTVLVKGYQPEGYWLEYNAFATAEHGGTHADAPGHFYRGSWKAHEIPAQNLVGPAVVVDVRKQVASNPNYLMTVEDLLMWERRYGRIPQRAVVLMNSGWDSRYPDPRLVFNTDTPSDRFSFRFPTIHPAAAHFLVTQRDVIVVGVDTASLDPGFSRTFDTHVILGRANVVMLEHVANVGRLPPSGATVVVGLVKLRGGSGGPARVLAIMGDRCDCLVCVKRPRDTRALWTIL